MRNYYRTSFVTYNERTFHVDPSPFLEPLCRFLPPCGQVLDVGCGGGRDLRWLRQRGYAATGFEQSEGLAALAEGQSGCPVIRGDFTTYDFSRHSVNGLLLVGALVHTAHDRIVSVMGRILPCLAPGGVVLLTLKKGRGRSVDPTGRTFFFWQSKDLEPVCARLGLDTLEILEKPSALKTGQTWLSCYLRRPGSRLAAPAA